MALAKDRQAELYTANEIKVLKGLEAVRKRPGMYIGSTGLKGLHHLVWEVVDNAIDEYMAGFGNKIEVILLPGNAVKVVDEARGIPVDVHPETGRPAVEVVLTTLHAGGKFDNKNYKVSGGLHGVGLSVVNALSQWLEVEIHRDGIRYYQKYERGQPVTGLEEKEKSDYRGTIITFKPDPEIFETIDFRYETLANRLQESAFLNKDLKIILEDKRSTTTRKDVFSYKGGLIEFIKYLNKERDNLHKEIFYIHKDIENNQIEVALQYNDGYNERILSFANNINTQDGGYHLTGFKTALTRALNNFAREKNLLSARDSSLTGKDVREGLTAVISVRLPNPQFEGQTKTKLGNSEIRSQVESIVYENFRLWLDLHPDVGKKIIDKALQAVRARKASQKVRELTRRKNALNSHSLPGKLADCTSRNPEECEIFLVEGDSAGGSAKQGRKRSFQAILPLKGKILNVERARMDKILGNNEIRTIITALGCGIGDEFDIKKLRYHKVIIMTDADVDGAHICTLLLTLFYRYMPQLIENGHIYIAQPPLYGIRKGKEINYLYSDRELQEYMSENSGNVSIQRYKGLGEMNPHQLWKTTMNPETRKLQRIEIDNPKEAEDIFYRLMGNKVQLRKEFIMKNADDVEELDI